MRALVRVFGQKTGEKRQVQRVQLVCRAVGHDRLEAGVRQQHLLQRLCRRVAVVSRLQIKPQQP